ncbi:FGGY-family carbohydrate kinase [Sphingobacterium psychroaquaticum]|uniref:Autoinducer 2 (AI-2) kinase n=1 Tax=Sphingobacterium psychroaquaticum TaxID=561061 RepID=A0A1X7ICK7_9SPHI|nr:FGGY family carbohydrate kinase [Sphingobacterium psychroaquaticum]SMG12175.1 autoinducer 2 (AI-2) kinase [Sphingobacterium psychroaquaticum]
MTTKREAYLIVDIGTGNARVAVCTVDGEILGIKRENVQYESDHRYEDSIYFDPNTLWNQILRLAQQALVEAGDVQIKAVTATSQREGIVIIDKAGNSLLGMPNIDHRGRKWEKDLQDKDLVYNLSGRYPTSLFSAFKLVGVREVYPEIFEKIDSFMSISDWVQFQFSGVVGYEHSQASETLLYDVEKKVWSDVLLAQFGLSAPILPPLKDASSILGTITPVVASTLSINPEAVVVVGGGDTQLAICSMVPSANDVVIVSGTTTPIIKIVDSYEKDDEQRTWTSRHIDEGSFILEANAGVTGLNYQRLKEIFYPNEGYDVIEKELELATYSQCVASLGSLIADEEEPLTKGGFIFNAPVSHQLTRGSFVFAILWDIACSIYENYKFLCAVSPHHESYIWACGGGVESRKLRQFMANLFGKSIKIRDTFRQASVLGGVFVCNSALGVKQAQPQLLEEVHPENHEAFEKLYQEWKSARKTFKQVGT